MSYRQIYEVFTNGTYVCTFCLSERCFDINVGYTVRMSDRRIFEPGDSCHSGCVGEEARRGVGVYVCFCGLLTLHVEPQWRQIDQNITSDWFTDWILDWFIAFVY